MKIDQKINWVDLSIQIPLSHKFSATPTSTPTPFQTALQSLDLILQGQCCKGPPCLSEIFTENSENFAVLTWVKACPLQEFDQYLQARFRGATDNWFLPLPSQHPPPPPPHPPPQVHPSWPLKETRALICHNAACARFCGLLSQNQKPDCGRAWLPT